MFCAIVCILVWLPDDECRSDQNMLVNSNVWQNIFYQCALLVCYISIK